MDKSDLERFIGYITADQSTGCWIWLGGRDRKGYGKFWYGATRRTSSGRAHRFAVEFFRGPIPPGLEPDHLCRNTSCVNPDHLEVVTRRENLLRGNSPVGVNARKLHCSYGHPFTKENTHILRWKSNGKDRYCRSCRACNRRRALKRYYAQKEKHGKASALLRKS